MSRHVIAVSAVLILGSLRGWPQESPGGPTVTLKIEVSLLDGAFSIFLQWVMEKCPARSRFSRGTLWVFA